MQRTNGYVKQQVRARPSIPWAFLILLFVCGLGAPLQAQEVPTTTACLECHGVAGTRPAGQAADGTSLFLEDWKASVHAALECIDCHTTVRALPHDAPLPAADCSTCHGEDTELYRKSAHGRRAAAGDSLAPTCSSCHDPHSVRPSDQPESVLHRTHLAAVCTRCHGDANGAGARHTAVPHPAESYARGAHARAMAAGNEKAATCKDCHESHGVLGADDPASPIHYDNIPRTCGQCHVQEFTAYHASVHSVGVAQGAQESPVCNTCHGEHAVLDLGEEGQSTVVASETCESCHKSPALARRYDLSQGAVASYEDSYHGRAARGGLAGAAGCTSCHGVHRILAAADSASSIHPSHRLATCKRCHAQATPEFAASYGHAPKAASVGDRGAATVRRIYTWLIALVIGGMIMHNLVLFAHDQRQRWQHHRSRATHQRLDRNELAQHFVLLFTFSLLVLTGFALKYDHTFWARWLEAIGMDESVRRLVHRLAGVGLIVASFYHVIYLCTRRGREQLGHMTPRLRDVREVGHNLAYHLGRTPVRPAFSRFRYIEKAEYWALLWGTVVMVVSGLILWFPDRLTGPSWLFRVAEAVHLYEAWLALLAIVVWHFFFVMLRPGIFPGSFTVLDGRMEPEELEREHPEEYWTHYRKRLRRPAPEDAGDKEPAADAAMIAAPVTDAVSALVKDGVATPVTDTVAAPAGNGDEGASTPSKDSS